MGAGVIFIQRGPIKISNEHLGQIKVTSNEVNYAN